MAFFSNVELVWHLQQLAFPTREGASFWFEFGVSLAQELKGFYPSGITFFIILPENLRIPLNPNPAPSTARPQHLHTP
jgi:hypothetical protein